MLIRTLAVALVLMPRLLAGTALAQSKKTPAGPDFNALATHAYRQSPPDREAMNELWLALFKLPQWHFLMTPTSAVNKQPSVQSIGGEGWLLVFTDSEKLKHYATTNKNLASDGSALYLSMTPDAARAFVAGYQGTVVVGVRFNEGAARGWFAPLRNIPAIHEFLKKNGKL